jgi:hypothetical protein
MFSELTNVQQLSVTGFCGGGIQVKRQLFQTFGNRLATKVFFPNSLKGLLAVLVFPELLEM